MTTWEAILLGIIQGLTEFLPVSSSGHLELGQLFLGFQNLNSYILFDLICHLGTLVAIVAVFFSQIKQNLQPNNIKQIILGTLPLFPLVLIIKPIKSIFDQPQYLGFCFLITALLLTLGSRFAAKQAKPNSLRSKWGDPLIIGLFQALAILPGISRSGSTISAARLLGWQKEDAVTFSFLLAIPAILGGITLEFASLFRVKGDTLAYAPIHIEQLMTGFVVSFFVGWLALKLLIKLTTQNKWHYFIWYCSLLGIASIYYFNIANMAT